MRDRRDWRQDCDNLAHNSVLVPSPVHHVKEQQAWLPGEEGV